MEKNLTSGSVLKTVIYFSLPYLLSYFLQTLYGMADLFIIGQFGGVDGTTAVSVGSQVMHMLTVMIVGLAMGATVLIGRAVGAGDRKLAARGIGNTISLFAGLSILLTGLLLTAVHGIIRQLSVPEEAINGTAAYLMICFTGIPFITAYNIISSIFRGMGDSKSPMYFVAIACIINIALDYLLMGVFSLGPSGAALGTTLSQMCSVLIALVVIIKKRMFPGFRLRDLHPHKTTIASILQVGIPVAVQDGFIQVSFLVITMFANQRGLNDAAAVGIVESCFWFPPRFSPRFPPSPLKTWAPENLSVPVRRCATRSASHFLSGWSSQLPCSLLPVPPSPSLLMRQRLSDSEPSI